MRKASHKKIFFVFLALLLIPIISFAQANLGLDTAGSIGLGTTDLPVIIVNIIRIFLSLLGLIAVGVIIWAGLQWMTAGGNPEQVGRAKKWMINGLIGLVIIMASFGIASFVINNLKQATGLSEATGDNNSSGGGGLPGGGFVLSSWQPSNNSSDWPRNIIVRAYFSGVIDATTLDENDITFIDTTSNNNIPFVLEANGSRLDIAPQNSCAVDGVDYCLPADHAYQVSIVNGSIRSLANHTLQCGQNCQTVFSVGNSIDNTAPNFALVQPVADSLVALDSLVPILGQPNDNSSVIAAVTFLANDDIVQPVGSDTDGEPWTVDWVVSGYNAGEILSLSATAEDLSGNVGYAPDVRVIVRPEHCFNGYQDADETGIDVGGSCGAALGESCNVNNSCGNGDQFCAEGSCSEVTCTCEAKPIVMSITPADGAVGNLITIYGSGFGQDLGVVTFLGSAASGDEQLGDLNVCLQSWTNNQVIVAVPDNAVSGGIKLTTASGRFDTTLDELGWQGEFDVNTVVRPGLCSVDPTIGPALSLASVQGINLGSSADNQNLFVGGQSANIGTWQNSAIDFIVPNLLPSSQPVSISIQNDQQENSNPVYFVVQPDIVTPHLYSINPAGGPAGQYITLTGTNFGTNPSEVNVKFVAADNTATEADIDFPAMCGERQISNTEMVVKVPAIAVGDYAVDVRRLGKVSESIDFSVVSGQPGAGLCALLPDNGPNGISVQVVGDNFSNDGSVNFYNNQTAQTSNWQANSVDTVVPDDAVSGPVSMMLAGQVSNSINFSVGTCSPGPGEELCADGSCRPVGECLNIPADDDYTWSFTTGEAWPPFVVSDYWPACNSACTNADVAAVFSNPLDTNTIMNNVEIWDCGEDDMCLSSEQIDLTNGNVWGGNYDASNNVLHFLPLGISANHNYRVVMTMGNDGIKNAVGENLTNPNFDKNGDGIDDSFAWIFSTGEQACVPARAEVLPSPIKFTRLEQSETVYPYPYSAADSCSATGQPLLASDYSWAWSLSSALPITLAVGSNYAIVRPRADGQSRVLARINDYGVIGRSFVTVDMDIPVITAISPDNGTTNTNVKTLVTISGYNFGEHQGSSYVEVGGTRAQLADCGIPWSDTQIIIELPATTQSGDHIKVIKTTGEDISDQAFTVNNIIRPALCGISPNYGTDGDSVTLSGYNFGDTQVDSMVMFDQLGVDTINSWSNQSIRTIVPPGASTGPVYVNVLGNNSNAINFSLEPFITKLDPNNGPVNSYVTIYGGNFGDTRGNGRVMIGGQLANLAPCVDNWNNTTIIVQVPEGLDLGKWPVQIFTANNIPTNTVDFTVNENPLNPLLCQLDPNWASNNESIKLKGDNFGDAPYFAGAENVDMAVGADYSNIMDRSCIYNNGTYIGSCSNLWVDYQFNFNADGYYNAWAETSNHSIDLTDQGIYHNVVVYLDGQYIGQFSNVASNPDHNLGSVGLGWVSAGNHTVRYYWNNDWCGGCGDGIGDSNILFHKVGIDEGAPMSYALFTDNYAAETNSWQNTEMSANINESVLSGPVSLVKEVVTGRQCAGFHIGGWCPGGVYDDITTTTQSNSLSFIKGCVIGTTSSRVEGYIPTVAENSEAVGTLATDGRFLYGKSWGGYDRHDRLITRIGSGYQYTVLGKVYSHLAYVADSLTMTYYPDGYIYNGYSTNGHNLQRINAGTGSTDMSLNIPDGLLNRNTGEVYSGVRSDYLITSDGTYIYNLAFSTHACPQNYGNRCYDGFKVRVFDPMDDMSLVREWTSGTDSFYTDGIIADGKYVYAFEWSGQHRVRKMDAITGEFVAEWISEQGGPTGEGNDIISGQYDWVNDTVWMGDLVDHSRNPGPAYIYQYNSCHFEDGVLFPRCGDGILQQNGEPGDSYDYTSAHSGNINSYYEQCDDGNLINGDGCSSWCALESVPVSSNFIITDHEPAVDAPANTTIRLFFSDNVATGSLADRDITITAGENNLSWNASVNNNVITLLPTQVCGAPHTDLRCWPTNQRLQVVVAEGSIKNIHNQGLSCNNGKCEFHIQTTDQVDVIAPQISLLTPTQGQQVPVGSSIAVQAQATDDTDVAYVDFAIDGQSVGIVNQTGIFSGDQSYTVLNYFQTLRSVDINNDGYEDLLAFSNNERGFSVLLNNGWGGYIARQDYNVGAYYYSYDSGFGIWDVNNDGYLDVLLGNNNYAGKFYIFVNNGDGTFASRQTYDSAGHYPRAIATGDLNGDGYNDIAVANDRGDGNNIELVIFAGDAQGHWNLVKQLNIADDYSVTGLAISDYDNDGKDDIAVLQRYHSSNNLHIYWGQENLTSNWQKLAMNSGGYSYQLVSSDIDNNGNEDLLILMYHSGDDYSYYIQVLYNQDNRIFSQNSLPQSDGHHYYVTNSLLIKDTDNDDYSEIFAREGNVIVRWDNNGGAISAPAVLSNVPSSIYTLTDTNNDNRFDIISRNSNTDAIVLLNNGDGTYGSNNIVSFPYAMKSVVANDLDGDGLPELIMPYVNSISRGVTIYRTGAAGYQEQSNFDIFYDLTARATGRLYGALPDNSGSYYGWWGGDWHAGTGVGSGPVYAQVSGQSTDSTIVSGNLTPSPYDGVYADFDVDLGGGFSVRSTGWVYGYPSLYPYSAAVGNFNGDAYQDIILRDRSGSGSHYDARVLAGGSNGWQEQANYNNTTGASGYDWRTATRGIYQQTQVVDMNSDNSDDFLLFNATGAFSSFINDGTGKFTAINYEDSDTNDAYRFVMGDLTGDNMPDLAYIQYEWQSNSTNLYIVENKNGNLDFAQRRVLTSPDYINGLSIADFNNDGTNDVMVVSQSAGTLFYDRSSGQWRSYTADINAPKLAKAGLVDNDGLLDIVVVTDGGGVQVYYNQGDFTFTSGESFTLFSYYYGPAINDDALAIDDFNNDGQQDIVLSRSYGSDLAFVYQKANPDLYSYAWDTTGLIVGSQHTVQATAYDLDSHSTSSQLVTVTIGLQGDHCTDGLINFDENGLDCGGADCSACQNNISEIIVSPQEANVNVGEQILFNAQVIDNDGNLLSDAMVDWTSNSSDSIGISSALDGGILVSGQIEGEAIITASLGDISDDALVHVVVPVSPCGDGIVDSNIGEQCDFAADGTVIIPDNLACTSFPDYAAGSLGCTSQCELDFNQCVPGIPTSGVCVNTEISATFDSPMLASSFTLDKVHLYKLLSNDDWQEIPITFSLEDRPISGEPEQTILYIHPLDDLDPFTVYRAVVSGGSGGVMDMGGSILPNDYAWQFDTGETFCFIDRVAIEPDSYEFNSVDEQINFIVHAYDNENNVINGNYNWQLEGNSELVNIGNNNGQIITVQPTGIGNGALSLRALVDSGAQGNGEAVAPIDIFMCGAPWQYSNDSYNFAVKYCRGDGPNMIYNSGFEQDNNNDIYPDGWEMPIGNALVSDYTARLDEDGSGKVFTIIQNNTATISHDRVLVRQYVPVKPQTTYSINFKIKAENINNRPVEIYELADRNGARLGDQPLSSGSIGSYDWETNSLIILTNADTNYLEVGLVLYMSRDNNLSQIWFDDMQLELGNQASSYQASNLLPDLVVSEVGSGFDDPNLLTTILLSQQVYGSDDAIGMRVYSNFNHLDPLSWYQNNIVTQGQPQSIIVGGYSALQEGRSTYVNAANIAGADVYTNIYLLSYTQGAGNDTQNMFTQIYNNWSFNTNLSSVALRQRLVNDTLRWEGLNILDNSLREYYDKYGFYPKLLSGTYQVGNSVSVWDSWQSTLATALGIVAPIDPINSHSICPAGYDSVTCWNPEQQDYVCPLGSHIYQYHSLSSGQHFELNSNFEYGGVVWRGSFQLPVDMSEECDNIIWSDQDIDSNEAQDGIRGI